MKTHLATAATALCLYASAAAAQEAPKLVTILTEAEPQTQLMAMVLTLQAAKQGAAPHVLLCDAGGALALKDAPESATAGQPPMDVSPQGLMQKIMTLPGAKVEVCALYLPGLGQGPEILLEGVGVAKPAAMAQAMMAADARMSF
ncbi:hypothetical protein J7400_09980 [Shimia sp. R9_2]|nr:hypothetical protein [Shimia sp. R9_2]MBO9397011.1 hypothetical protein [Shimia sp. R9_2]